MSVADVSQCLVRFENENRFRLRAREVRRRRLRKRNDLSEFTARPPRRRAEARERIGCARKRQRWAIAEKIDKAARGGVSRERIWIEELDGFAPAPAVNAIGQRFIAGEAHVQTGRRDFEDHTFFAAVRAVKDTYALAFQR